jgi:hypothetical protein
MELKVQRSTTFQQTLNRRHVDRLSRITSLKPPHQANGGTVTPLPGLCGTKRTVSQVNTVTIGQSDKYNIMRDILRNRILLKRKLPLYNDTSLCPRCDTQLQNAISHMICPGCNYMSERHILSNVQYKIPQREYTRVVRLSSYERYLAQFSTATTTIPNEVLTYIYNKLIGTRELSVGVRVSTVTKLLRTSEYKSYIHSSHYLTRVLNSYPPVHFTPEIIETLKRHFQRCGPSNATSERGKFNTSNIKESTDVDSKSYGVNPPVRNNTFEQLTRRFLLVAGYTRLSRIL